MIFLPKAEIPSCGRATLAGLDSGSGSSQRLAKTTVKSFQASARTGSVELTIDDDNSMIKSAVVTVFAD